MLVRFGRVTAGVFLALVMVGLIAACGGNQSAPANTGTVAPAATPMSEMQRETAAMPLAKAAPVPKGLNCKGDIVWVNTAKKTYHEAGDPYYGRTKHGEYMCKAAADAAGYHMAGMRHSPKSAKNNMMMTPAPYST
jgi:hypothetical protein